MKKKKKSNMFGFPTGCFRNIARLKKYIDEV